MSGTTAQPLPSIRRVVTSVNPNGESIILSDSELPSAPMHEVKRDILATGIWVTNDGVPTDDNNNQDDGGQRVIEDKSNFGLVPTGGTNCRSTELAPGAVTSMHRTTSLDYNILISGELVLINEDGTEIHLKHPGDTVVQRGTLHAWKNPTDQWTRWITVLVAANPVLVDGKPIAPQIV